MFLHVDLSSCRTVAHDLSINVDGYAGEIPVFISFKKVQSCRGIDSLGKGGESDSFYLREAKDSQLSLE